MGLTEKVIDSRLGSCWKCMSFCALMLVVCTMGLFVTSRWIELEGDNSMTSNLALLASEVGTILFALLSIAHFACLVLRKTVWADSRL